MWLATSGAEMRTLIQLTTRPELTAAIRQRYEAADRNNKKMILDELVKVTGHHRKHAIRVLTAQVDTQREGSVTAFTGKR